MLTKPLPKNRWLRLVLAGLLSLVIVVVGMPAAPRFVFDPSNLPSKGEFPITTGIALYVFVVGVMPYLFVLGGICFGRMEGVGWVLYALFFLSLLIA